MNSLWRKSEWNFSISQGAKEEKRRKWRGKFKMKNYSYFIGHTWNNALWLDQRKKDVVYVSFRPRDLLHVPTHGHAVYPFSMAFMWCCIVAVHTSVFNIDPKSILCLLILCWAGWGLQDELAFLISSISSPLDLLLVWVSPISWWNRISSFCLRIVVYADELICGRGVLCNNEWLKLSFKFQHLN